MTRILTIIALLFATPVWALPECAPTFSSIEENCINSNEKFRGGYIGQIRAGNKVGAGSELLETGRRIARFERDTANGWTIMNTDHGTSYIEYKYSSRKSGILLKNNEPWIIFKKTGGGAENVAGAIFLPDGRVFKGIFKLSLKNEFILPRQKKVRGTVLYPEESAYAKYYGEVEIWANKQVDLDGFGVMALKNGESSGGDYLRDGAGVVNRVGAATSVLTGVFTLGLSTAMQVSDRRGADDLVQNLSALEGEVDEFLNDFAVSSEVAQLEADYSELVSNAETRTANAAMEKYKQQCRGFGYTERDANGNTLPEFSKCVQETFFKMEELKVIEQTKALEMEQERQFQSERTKMLREDNKKRQSAEDYQRKLNTVNSYLDREQRRIDALNQGIRNNAPITCTTGPPMGGYVNTTCR